MAQQVHSFVRLLRVVAKCMKGAMSGYYFFFSFTPSIHNNNTIISGTFHDTQVHPFRDENLQLYNKNNKAIGNNK